MIDASIMFESLAEQRVSRVAKLAANLFRPGRTKRRQPQSVSLRLDN